MKTQLLSLLFVVLVALCSCQKEVNDPNPASNSGGADNSTGTYLPLTQNTYWKYQDSISGQVSIMTVLNATKTIDGRSYTEVFSSNDTQSDTVYMTRQGADYFMYAEVDNGSSSGTFLFHYLNDTAAVGSSWEYAAGQGNGFTAYFKTTVVERNITQTVHGKTYNEVIHTRMDMSYDILGQRTPAAVYDYYIAKNIGIVQVKSKVGLVGIGLMSSDDLIDYQIK